MGFVDLWPGGLLPAFSTGAAARQGSTAVSGIVCIYEKTGRHEQAEALAMTAPEHTVPDLARLRADAAIMTALNDSLMRW